jgi:outer membrane receptor for ferrienterochelin and colicin
MNFGRTWVQGLEASFEASVATQFAARTGLTWSQSRNLSTAPSVANNQLPGVPTWTSATSTTWTHPSDRLHVGHTYRYTAGNFWDATNWYRAAPRQFHDLFLQWRLRRLQLELGAENVFNKLVDVVPQNPLRPNSGINAISAVTDFSGHPLPGRTLLVGLRWLGGEK